MYRYLEPSLPQRSALTLFDKQPRTAKTDPLVARQIEDHFYVDNWLTSFESDSEAIRHTETVSNVLHRGGFELAQWGSSSKSVLKSLPGIPVSTLNFFRPSRETSIERMLGLSLDYNIDAFVIKGTRPASRIDQTRKLKSDVECLRSTWIPRLCPHTR